MGSAVAAVTIVLMGVVVFFLLLVSWEMPDPVVSCHSVEVTATSTPMPTRTCVVNK